MYFAMSIICRSTNRMRMPCECYRSATDVDKVTLEDDYRLHITRKNRAREEKELDKVTAKEDECLHAITMDPQSVLSIPCGSVSALYYTRKLSVYNLTTVFTISLRAMANAMSGMKRRHSEVPME